MAVNSNVSQSGERSGGRPWIAAFRSDAWLRLQALRPGDAGIAARGTIRVRNALGEECSLVQASAVGGYLELRGSVPSREAFNRASAAANGTSGAQGVLNFLEVR